MALESWAVASLKAREAILKRFETTIFPWQAPELSRSEAVCVFLENLTISQGRLHGSTLRLRPFQRDFVEKVYRTVEDGRRPVRTAVLSVGRKNGKTQLAAGLALAHLCGPEAEPRGEVYSCANDRAQAGKIFSEMCALIKPHEYLRARCNVLQHTLKIIDLETGSLYQALSREAKTKLGLNPSFVVHDELGSSDGRELFDAMNTAMGARESPLMLIISTQAAEDIAPLSQLIDYGIRVKKREITDPTFHLSLHTSEVDDDPWDPETWKKANPALDDFRSLEDVERQAQQAQRLPTLENAFRNLILNQRVAAEVRFMERTAWKACGGKPEIPDGARVYAALDLGATRDMSALILIYKDPYEVFHVKPFFWLPGDVKARTDADRVPYDTWAKQGHLIATGESGTDPAMIARKIAELNGKYRILGLAFDRWRIADLKRELNAIACPVPLLEFGQGYKDMSPAVDILERLVVQKRIRHGNHPVLQWNAFNAVVVKDPAGSRKLDKSRSVGKIDGLVALAMAFALALLRAEPELDARALIA
jgi:phage terminase large subunit-like protein